jgi:ASPIC and UnbV/FG-GAP-like repeat
MLKRVSYWTAALAVVATLLYSARSDLLPHLQRLAAEQWRHFEPNPLPVEMIAQIYDMGVADVDNDGHLDLYTSNHNYRQYLFVNTGDGSYKDVLGEWKLDQSRPLPGIEQSWTPPPIGKSGLYIYWIGDTLHLRFHQIESLGPVKVSLQLFNHAQVLKNEGVALRQDVAKAGDLTEERLELSAAGSGHVVLFLDTRGAPLRFAIDSTWARANTFVGSQAIVPQPRAGMVNAGGSTAGPSCATCLEFEMTLLDRHSMAWADINDDGTPDVFVNRGALSGTLRSYPKAIRDQVADELLVSKGSGRFEDRSREWGIEKKDCSGRHVRWIDFDRDGLLDLFINCQERGTVAGDYPKQLYRQRRDKHFEDVAAKFGLDLPKVQIIDMVWFDADGDSTIDLFTHEDSGYVLHRLVDGKYVRQLVHVGPFHRASVPGLRGDTSDYWQFDGKLSVADFNADGRLDVFVASKRGNVLLVNDGAGKFRSMSPASIGLPADSVAAAWVDYDNDGRMDLHVVPDGLFRQDPGGRFVRTGLLALPAAKYQAAIINWYDRDNDGDLDVVMALQENASLWRWWDKLHKSGDVKGKDNRFDWEVLGYDNVKPESSWLQLQLVGKAGNAEAIGAQVRLRTKSGQQTRQVGSHDGAYLSHGHYRMYFGLGGDSGPVSLDITWPDGTRQTLDDVAINQRLTLKAPA